MNACTLCGVKNTPTDRHNFDVVRLRNGTSYDLFFCESCGGVLRVALDRTYETAGEPPLSCSVACAFAFHLGQYEASAIVEGWERDDALNGIAGDRARFRNWRSPDFTAPYTKERLGWGRWSNVRRGAGRRPWDPLYENDQVDAAAYVMTGVHVGGGYLRDAGRGRDQGR